MVNSFTVNHGSSTTAITAVFQDIEQEAEGQGPEAPGIEIIYSRGSENRNADGLSR